MNRLTQDMIFQTLMWISKSSFHQIHYFKTNELIFSTYDSANTLVFARENPFRTDSELFATLCVAYNASKTIEWMPCSYFQAEPKLQNIYYGIIELSPEDACIVGPLTIEKLSPLQLREYMQQHHMNDFKNFFIPAGSISQLTALLSLIAFVLLGTSQTATLHVANNVNNDDDIANLSNDILLQGYQLGNSELGIQHLPYKVESHIMSCVREGNLDTLLRLHDESKWYSSGKMSESALKQMEYTSVISVSLMARAAIDGGVNPYHAYDMNDFYLQRISKAKTERSYQNIQAEATKDFIAAVKKSQSLNSQSLHTEKCKQYVARHLNCPFTLDDISSDVGLNRTYLSGLFRQYESMTLKEYTHRERIGAAKNMLQYSDYTLSQIAEYFCFQSQSHFGKIFKKYVGITPMQYRRQAAHKFYENFL